jgi:hypothetical protein
MPQPGYTSTQILIIKSLGGGEGEEEDDEARRIMVVTGLVEAPMIRRTTRISIGPRGRPQGLLTPRTTTPPTSLTPSLVTPPPSGSGTPSNLLSQCGNRVLWWFARFAAPTDKGRVQGSWDSMARPSQ